MIINPEDLPNYGPGDVLFPNIVYDAIKLTRKKTTIKAAYTNISNCGQTEYLRDLHDIWKSTDRIDGQNNMLAYMEGKILEMIKQWTANQTNDFLFKKIFIWIQLWGGNMSRGFFLHKNGGFENNFDSNAYFNAIQNVMDKPLLSLKSLNSMNQMGTSFATKHLNFWSNLELPIYDNIIAMIVFGRLPSNNINHYEQYLGALNELSTALGKPRRQIERSLFNFYDINKGKKWFDYRKSQLGRK